MRTIRTKVYQFSELSKAAQQKAIEWGSDLNVNFDWWDFIYEDASTIGLKITGFDIDRASYVNGDFTLSPNEVAANIFNEHGEDCETYKTAAKFMKEWQPVFSEYMDENSEKYESGDSENELQDIEDSFLKSLCEDYLKMLRDEYEYQTTEKAIIETIEANEYEFTQDGRRF